MAKVYITSAAQAHPDYPRAHVQSERLSRLADIDRIGRHERVESAEHADLILFAEHLAAGPYFEDCRRHPLYRQYVDRCLIYTAIDRPLPLIRGVYVSAEQSWNDPSRVRSGHYLGINESENLRYSPLSAEPEYLGCFIGRAGNARVRRDLMKLESERLLVIDSESLLPSASKVWQHLRKDPARLGEYKRSYAEMLLSGAFSLCPRGLGTSTWRLFESMIVGRSPVILSDEWVEPTGPEWNRFSIRVKEKDVGQLEPILEERADQAAEMGAAARAAWENWFSPQVTFHRIVEWCLEILAAGPENEEARRRAYLHFFRPEHLARYLVTRVKLLRERKRLVL